MNFLGIITFLSSFVILDFLIILPRIPKQVQHPLSSALGYFLNGLDQGFGGELFEITKNVG